MSNLLSSAYRSAGVILFFFAVGQFILALILGDIDRMVMTIGVMIIGIGFMNLSKQHD